MFTSWFAFGKPDLSMALNGILAGLVGITSPCSTCSNFAAFVIGFSSAFVFYGSSKLLLKLKIDDVVNAAPVHGFCGAWGVICSALFATPLRLARSATASAPSRAEALIDSRGVARAVLRPDANLGGQRERHGSLIRHQSLQHAHGYRPPCHARGEYI